MTVVVDQVSNAADRPRVTFWLEKNTLRVASVIVLLVLWQIAGMSTETYVLPTPVDVFASWWKLTLSGELITAAGSSAFVFLLGFAAALVLGCRDHFRQGGFWERRGDDAGKCGG